MGLITCRVRREGGKKSFNKPKEQFLEEKVASKKLVQYEKVVDVHVHVGYVFMAEQHHF